MATNIQALEQVWQGLSAGRTSERGQLFSFVSPFSGNGTSYIVREMAMIAARQNQENGNPARILIVDMDIQNSAQAEYFFSNSAMAEYGAPEGPYDACFGAEGFWRVTPAMLGDDGHALTDAHFMSMHVLPSLALGFTNFHWQKFKRGQTVHIQEARNYWQNLREYFSDIFVDIPALDRTDILKTICPEADKTVLISNPADANLRPIGDLYAKLVNMNANPVGMIINELPRSNSRYGGNL